MNEQLVHYVALSMVEGIGDLLAKQLISYCGDIESVFATPKGKVLKIPGIGPATAQAITKTETLDEARKLVEKCDNQNIRILTFLDEDYPIRLKDISDAPLLIYYSGNIQALKQQGIAIVGTRQATAYGKKVIEHIVDELSPLPITIVSGLAYGIDIKAHKQAVSKDLSTIGVMASGLDIIYPSAHKQTAQQMKEHGGLLTENPLGVKPDAFRFPARNRIIAGMSDALIVVEAAEKGGALISADIAHSYNREVFAVPGNLDNKFSAGCNQLIRQNKAQIFTSMEDLYHLIEAKNLKKEKVKRSKIPLELNKDEQLIYDILNKESLHLDVLAIKTQLPINQIASTLLTLEFKGLVKALPGKVFALS